MEEMFRFMIIRPPSAIGQKKVISLESDTDLQKSLKKLPDIISKKRFASAFSNSDEYVYSKENLMLGDKLEKLFITLETNHDLLKTNNNDFIELVKKFFGKDPKMLLHDGDLIKEIDRVADSIITIKLLPEEHLKPLTELSKLYRVMSLIRHIGEEKLGNGEIYSVLCATLKLPQSIFSSSQGNPKIASHDVSDNPAETSKSNQVLVTVNSEIEKVQKAIDEMMEFEPVDLVEYPALPQKFIPPKIIQNMTNSNTNQPLHTATAGPIKKRSLSITIPLNSKLLIMTSHAIGRLSSSSQMTLKKLNIDPANTRIDLVVNKLFRERSKLIEVASEIELIKKTHVTVIGNSFIRSEVSSYSKLDKVSSASNGIPSTHGSIKPIGVADLLIVRQQLKRYQAGDIAHVENVLKGEAKERQHKRSSLTEEFFATETETTTEQERELETTERFEFQKEANDLLKQDTNAEAGLKVTGKYGVSVSFEANAKGAVSQSRQRSAKFANEYSREISIRAVNKVTERIKEQRTMRNVTQIEETNSHKLDNVKGKGHVVGIYQWLEKVFEAQIFNYGLRTMYEFSVAEPAAFLIEALKKNYEITGIERPEDLDITPQQLNERNYQLYIKKYEVTGVKPPPEPYITVSKTFRGGPDDGANGGRFNDSSELALPDGYEAYYAIVIPMLSYVNNVDWRIDISVGEKQYSFSQTDGFGFWTGLSRETGSIPFTLTTLDVPQFAISVEAVCVQTKHAYQKWKLETYDSILQAYLKKRSQYEEKLAALKVQTGIEIAGRHPTANIRMIKDELKKVCISMLTQQHYNMFDSIEEDLTMEPPTPQVNLSEAQIEGDYIKFFEQAFEWENMTFSFYPYFWGRKNEWIERINYKDVDPVFEAFLKAGSSRVIVPVRPTTERMKSGGTDSRIGFEAAIDHFVCTGEIWGGAGHPDIGSDLFVPIIEEIKDVLGAPGEEVQQGEPWEVVLPTTLVKLRESITGSLPTWVKVNGKWVPE